MAINFDLNDLLAFRAVADLSNFRRAAESIHISQPAFSRRIDKLEQALGVRLLERTTRRVSLTAVGRDFARKVEQLLDDLDNTLLGVRGVAALTPSRAPPAAADVTAAWGAGRVGAGGRLVRADARDTAIRSTTDRELSQLAAGGARSGGAL